ncbi:OpgC family protein [Bradyrhizobium sp.]|uniref:OpgC family protein n=1 Tax=Bradyrhizobium sp. TaxID=376 RepID=UPI00239CCB15|nr:OpgC domain-containing protein [Bradyrhizobium sp.]MDE1936371.1 OpgC domain-containing protein [Bradyrhizobium sp.]
MPGLKLNPVEIPRDFRLDLYRGFALWLIFLAHIPGTIFNRITPWNHGFSDPAEVFIFVSGYANAYVYGRVMEQRGFLVGAAQIVRRAVEAYIAQIFLFVIVIGEAFWLSHGSHALDDAMNIAVVHQRPDESILALLQLKFMPVNMNVLPLYVVVLAVSPAVLWLLRKAPALALVLAISLYAAANGFGLNFPAFPSGYWYFDPFAWQLLFVLGAWCGLGAADWVWRLARSRWVLILSAVYAVLVFALFLPWNGLNLGELLPEWSLYAFGKTNLGVLRLVHFLALAVVVDRLIPRDWPPLNWLVLRPLVVSGQHSLEVFCLGVALAFAGQVAAVEAPGNALIRLLVAVTGIAAMVAVSALLSWYNSTRVSFRIIADADEAMARPVRSFAPPVRPPESGPQLS